MAINAPRRGAVRGRPNGEGLGSAGPPLSGSLPRMPSRPGRRGKPLHELPFFGPVHSGGYSHTDK